MGFRVLGVRVQGLLGFRVQGLLGFRAQGLLGFIRVDYLLEFRVQGLGFLDAHWLTGPRTDPKASDENQPTSARRRSTETLNPDAWLLVNPK